MGSQRQLRAGSRVGDLVVERAIGRGAFGAVYVARDTLLGRAVALKVLPMLDDAIPDAERERFLAEARLIARLKSPHVTTLYRVHATEDFGYIVEMEYAAGGSLQALLDRQAQIPMPRALEIMRGVAMGLAAAHEAGIVHGDLKPANVLLDAAGNAKLADFGLAHVLHDSSRDSSIGALTGTPRFMAPEVVMGSRPGRAADIWGFGVMLYRLIAGRLPFDGPNLAVLFHAIQNAAPPPLPETVPEPIATLTMRALARDPADRPRTAEHVLAELDASGRARRQGLPRPATPRVFGREAELVVLTSLLESEQAAGVLITGDAGIGKSTILDAGAALAQQRGCALVSVRITSMSGVLRPMLASIRGIIDPSTIDARFHASASILKHALAGESDAFESPQQVLWSVERLLQCLAAKHPVFVAIEDAHEADPKELQQLSDLRARLADERILFAATYRTQGAAGDHSHALTDRRRFERLELEPIPSSSLLRAVEQAAGATHVEAEVAHRLVEQAHGNPLFVKELLRHLLELKAVVVTKGKLVPAAGWRERSLPRRVRDLVVARIHGLPEEERAILDAAAADGPAFDSEAVAAVVDEPLLTVLRVLQRIYRERALIVPHAEGYRFSHPVIHEVIYDDLAPSLQRELHIQFARHLEARDEPDPEHVGIHWERAGNRAAAVPHLARAITLADKRQEVHRLISLCTRAGFFPEIDAAQARAYPRPHLALAICLADAGMQDKAVEIFATLQDAFAGEEHERFRLKVFLRWAKSRYGVEGPGAIDAGKLLQAWDTFGRTREGAMACYILGLLGRYKGNLEEADLWFERGESIYREIAWKSGLSDVLDQRATLRSLRGEPEAAERLYAEAAALSYKIGRRTDGAISDVNRALSAFHRGAFDGLQESLRNSIACLEIEGIRTRAAHARLVLADLLYATGELDDARREVSIAHEQLVQSEWIPGLSGALTLKIGFAIAEGALAEAHADLEALGGIAASSGIANTAAYHRALSVELACCEGRKEDAAAEAAGLVRTIQGLGKKTETDVLSRLCESVMLGLPATALADVATDSVAQGARTVLEGVRAWSTDGPAAALQAAGDVLLRPDVGERRAVLRVIGRRLRAEALRRKGAEDEAVAEAERALEAARRLGHVWHQAAILATLFDWTGDQRYSAERGRLSISA